MDRREEQRIAQAAAAARPDLDCPLCQGPTVQTVVLGRRMRTCLGGCDWIVVTD